MLCRLQNVTAVVAIAVASVITSSAVHADPPPWSDPHYPDWQHGNCVGGRGGGLFTNFCDGEHYPDNTYWHQEVDGRGVGFPMKCLIADGSPQPPIAPKGGCGGNA